MRTKLLASLTAALLVAACGESVLGQYSTSGSGRQGMFGSRTLGGGLSAGNRTFGGSSSFSGGGLGSSAFGGTGLGTGMGMGGGGLGSGLGSGMGSTGMGGGMLTGSERFVRGNRRPGQFVGSDVQDLANALGGLSSARGTQGINQTSRSGLSTQGSGRTSRANQPNQQGRGQARGQGGRAQGGRGRVEDVRTTVSTGFRYPQRAAVQVSSGLATRLEKSTRIGRLSPIRVVFAAETVTLQGVVQTEHDRVLAEQLARLEPGVRQVKNELLVGPASDSGATPSAVPAAGPGMPGEPAPPEARGPSEPLNPGVPPAPE